MKRPAPFEDIHFNSNSTHLNIINNMQQYPSSTSTTPPPPPPPPQCSSSSNSPTVLNFNIISKSATPSNNTSPTRSPLRQRLKLDLNIANCVPNCPSPPLLTPTDDLAQSTLAYNSSSSSTESTPFIASLKHSLHIQDSAAHTPSLPFLDTGATPRLPSSLKRAQSIPNSPLNLVPPRMNSFHGLSSSSSAPHSVVECDTSLPDLPPTWTMPTGASIVQAFSSSNIHNQPSSTMTSTTLAFTLPIVNDHTSNFVNETLHSLNQVTTQPITSEPTFMTTLAPKPTNRSLPIQINTTTPAADNDGSSSDDDNTSTYSSFDSSNECQPSANVEGPITHQYGTLKPRPPKSYLKDHPHGHVDPFTGALEQLPHMDDSDWDQDTIEFIANVPPLNPLYRTSPILPPISPLKTHTLVLDLDETLLHCTTTPLPEAGLTFAVDFNGVRFDIYGNLRPGVKKFLRKVSKAYEIVIFTASQQVYAERALQALDPGNKYISHVLHRDHCVPILGNYLKDLSVLGRDLRKTLIVDNAPQAFAYHPANGLPIRSWYDDPADEALQRLARRLLALVQLNDIRPAIRAMSYVHARLEDHARSTGRVPVGLAMAYDMSSSPMIEPTFCTELEQQHMDIDWPVSPTSGSRPASEYPQLWVGPATLPLSVITYLGIDLALQVHIQALDQQQQQTTTITMMDNKGDNTSDHTIDESDLVPEYNVRAHSPTATAVEDVSLNPQHQYGSTCSSDDLHASMGKPSSDEDERCVTPSIAERRKGITSTPEPLRLPLANNNNSSSSSTHMAAELIPLPQSTLTTPVSAMLCVSDSSGDQSGSELLLLSTSSFGQERHLPPDLGIDDYQQNKTMSTPLPTPLTPEFHG